MVFPQLIYLKYDNLSPNIISWANPELPSRSGNLALLERSLLEDVEGAVKGCRGGVDFAQHLARTDQLDPTFSVAGRLIEAACEPIELL